MNVTYTKSSHVLNQIPYLMPYNEVLYIDNNNNIYLLQTHGPYTYKKNVKHI